MSFLISQASQQPAGARFRQLVSRPGILKLPGVHNGLASLQAKKAGFEALYVSGGALSASMGLPDLGVLSKDDVCFFIRQISRASDLPMLVDGDTGYGGILNVMEAVRSFEDAGAGAIQIEDQNLPKKCGHLNDKNLVEPEEMAAKVAAAARVRRHLYIVARTDAVASEGVDRAVERAQLYVKAGADAIFPDALTSLEMFREFAQRIKVPLVANMTEFGRTPSLSADEFEAMGYKMVIWPVSSLRVAAKVQQELYEALFANGRADSLLQRMQTRAELYATIGYSNHEALDASLKETILTNEM